LGDFRRAIVVKTIVVLRDHFCILSLYDVAEVFDLANCARHCST